MCSDISEYAVISVGMQWICSSGYAVISVGMQWICSSGYAVISVGMQWICSRVISVGMQCLWVCSDISGYAVPVGMQ